MSLLLTAALLAAPAPDPAAPFVPRGHQIIRSLSADLDGDGKTDRVLVTQDKADPDGGRTLLVLRASARGLTLDTAASSVVLCEGCGGAYGDPLDSVTARKGEITVAHYGGSNWRWGNVYTFKLVKDRWQLSSLGKSFISPDAKVTNYDIPVSECQNVTLERLKCGERVLGGRKVKAARAFIYRSPNAEDRTGKYLVAGQTFTVYTEFETFVEGAFTAPNGQSTEGFMRRSDLESF